MNDHRLDDSAGETAERDYSQTLYLPKTDFPMRAGLPKKEPEILQHWASIDLYNKLREKSAGREKFVLHDGPPYANGNIHIGTGLNKILKDVVTRTFQMMGYDSNYVPGWDCHGLPIEWKIEEQYRKKGKDKDAIPVNEFRKECRDFATHWIGVQASEFQRLGVIGDFENPYTTMAFGAEALIANELIKFAVSGQLYRGSKPVMWSVVERTALAEAEVEYHDTQSDMIWTKFPVIAGPDDLVGLPVVIWTTTPWTIPGNRAISFSPRVTYGLYEATDAPDDNWTVAGDRMILADALAATVFEAARVAGFKKVRAVSDAEIASLTCAHPLRQAGLDGYGFDVPLLAGDHVTDDQGTGFVHTAPGHGREDFEAWMENGRRLADAGIDTAIPYTVDADGSFTKDAPGFTGERVINDKGEKGKANRAVMDALREQGMLVATGRLKHQYPHSWRSKKPVIFRNTPQWFVSMDRDLSELPLAARPEGADLKTLRDLALKAIDDTRFVPPQGQNRLRAMIENRPDWVLSRQRAWGVPITVFTHRETGQIVPGPDFAHNDALGQRIVEAFDKEGADAWFADGARERFLDGLVDNPADWDKVDDILDVWFDSGSTHAFCLEQRPDLKWPASIYLEGSDQHRGWFHSSLLESCGTRGRAPYDIVLTHGFVLDEEGRKMSKSLGNTVTPQDVIKQSGADILRLWAVSSDYWDDLRIGPEILKTNVDAYRKLRNTVRWMLGSLAHYEGVKVAYADMPELERLILHRLHSLDGVVRQGYRDFDYKKVFQALFTFITVDLSAFYFDVRKDALYCDPHSSPTRHAALSVIDTVFDTLTLWLAPMLCFTAEEAWRTRHPSEDGSVHLETFPDMQDTWRDDALAGKWAKIREVRRVVTGALEIERREKRIGSSLEAHPIVHLDNPDLKAALDGIDLAEIAITSQATLADGTGPEEAFRLEDVPGVAVVPGRAEGRKCARSWKVLPDIGADADWPDISPRDALAMREYETRNGGAGEA
ncbi:MAG: isoleucine--tRNA ligase [Pseudomonadota bacterium]